MSMLKIKNGFTLIETLVVLGIFSILAILVTSVIIYSLRGTRKSEYTYELREKLDQVVEVIDRQIRNAKQINSDEYITFCETNGANSIFSKLNMNRVSYIDQYGTTTSFDCGNESIASGSAILLNNQDANFSCHFDYEIPCAIGVPPNITFYISATSIATGPEGAGVSLENKIQLRSY